jgi:hypothetical protein
MFGFEVDTLEIALKEQLDYLDMIFIIESTVNQKGGTKNWFLLSLYLITLESKAFSLREDEVLRSVFFCEHE